MGVGAIFVSTLALSELKVPHDPPQNQEELLAATLQIIVSFIVLCSIIIRKFNPSIYRNAGYIPYVTLQMACPSRSFPSAVESTLAPSR
jgi:hypothetical protein